MQDQDHSMLKIEIDRVMTQNKHMTQLNVALNRDAMATAEILDQQKQCDSFAHTERSQITYSLMAAARSLE